MLLVEKLTIAYPRQVPVLKDLSFAVPEGQSIGVIGANGNGKTTLALALRGILSELYRAEVSGLIRLGETNLTTPSESRFLGLVGLVLQRPQTQLSGIADTVFDEVAFGLENLNLPATEINFRAHQELERMGILDLAQRHPRSLSGGQMQRVAMASVSVLRPRMLVLDEPSAQLDPMGAKALFEGLQELRKDGTILVICENRIDFIIPACQQLAVLGNDGTATVGPLAKILAGDEWESAGLPRPDFCELVLRLRRHGYLQGSFPETEKAALEQILSLIPPPAP